MEKEEGVGHAPCNPPSDSLCENNDNFNQVPEEEEEGTEDSASHTLPSDEEIHSLRGHLNQHGDPQLTETFEKIIDSLATLPSNNRFGSAHIDLLRRYLYPKDPNLRTDVGVQADGQEPSVTLTWSNLQDIVEFYAKDDQRRAELLESKHPSKHLLEVQPMREQVNALPLQGSDPEVSFPLTGSEFRTVVEGLATNEQKLTKFESLLDLGKDLYIGNDLPLIQRAESVVQYYQCLPESSKAKLLSALHSVGLSLSANAISLQSKKQ